MTAGVPSNGAQNAQPPAGSTAQNLLASTSGNVPSGYASAEATTALTGYSLGSNLGQEWPGDMAAPDSGNYSPSRVALGNNWADMAPEHGASTVYASIPASPITVQNPYIYPATVGISTPDANVLENIGSITIGGVSQTNTWDSGSVKNITFTLQPGQTMVITYGGTTMQTSNVTITVMAN